MHKYIREDSSKMNEFITLLDQHYEAFNNISGEMLPAFIIWDTLKEEFQKINPPQNSEKIKLEDFGDSWSYDLTKEDKNLIKNYFNKFEYVKKIWFF